MSFSELARLFDEQDSPREAAWAYEIAIQDPDQRVEVFLDLAVLYFEAQDFGYSSHHDLSDDFVTHAWVRAFEILDLAKGKNEQLAEITFWRAYFAFVYSENENIDRISRELIQQGESLVPSLYLFNASNRTEFKEEAKQLLKKVEAGNTRRERYIKGVLE